MPAAIAFNINGKATKVETEPDRPLLEVLREDLKLTGTKYGCGEGACGACSVLVDGKPTFSCSVPVSSVEGKSLVTIEGISTGDKLHPVQQAFLDERGFQCGYCTAGMIVAGVALLQRDPKPSDEKIVQAMNSHICRCCAYPQIVAAMKRAAGQSESRATLSPSPGTPGEGRGEGDFEHRTTLAIQESPSPYPSPGLPGEGTKHANG